MCRVGRGANEPPNCRVPGVRTPGAHSPSDQHDSSLPAHDGNMPAMQVRAVPRHGACTRSTVPDSIRQRTNQIAPCVGARTRSRLSVGCRTRSRLSGHVPLSAYFPTRRGSNQIALAGFWCSPATPVQHSEEGVGLRHGIVLGGQPLFVRCRILLRARLWAGSDCCVGLTSFFFRAETRKWLESLTFCCFRWKVYSIKLGDTLSMVARNHTPLRDFTSFTHDVRSCGVGGGFS